MNINNTSLQPGGHRFAHSKSCMSCILFDRIGFGLISLVNEIVKLFLENMGNSFMYFSEIPEN